MANDDELAEIDGQKPNVLLDDGEQRDVKSMTSHSVYKVKRTWDHYYCTCPAWRNQGGVPVNARSCKHLQELLGLDYEAARLKWKNPDGPSLTAPGGRKRPAKPASKAKAKPASSSKGKRKAVSDDDDSDSDDKPRKKKAKRKVDTSDEESSEDERPKKKKKSKSKRKDEESESEDESSEDERSRRKKRKGKKKKVDASEEDSSSDSEEDDKRKKKKASKKRKYSSDDESSEEEKSRKKKKSKRSRKESDSEDESESDHKSKRKPSSKKKPASKRAKDESDDDKPAKKPASKRKPTSKRVDDDDDDDGDNGVGVNGLPALLLANKWDIEKGPDPSGFWISEKLDGVRTFYNGKGMVSRLGNAFTPPKWLLEKLPKDVTLDGELFGGRGKFQDTVSIVKTMNSPHWKEITFQIFDIPSNNGTFEERMKALKRLFGPGAKYECPEVVLVEHEKAKSRQHVLDKLKEIEGLGGEGLMLRKAGSKYEGRRSSTLLKVKTFYDAEAEVTGYTDGHGKHAGLVGALKCKMESGKAFNCGSGLTDKQRKDPPKIGRIIVYRFQELTRDGVPRFPTFVGEAIDKKKAKDADIPAHRRTDGKKKDE